MKKHTMRMLSLLLSLTMLFGMLPAVSASEVSLPEGSIPVTEQSLPEVPAEDTKPSASDGTSDAAAPSEETEATDSTADSASEPTDETPSEEAPSEETVSEESTQESEPTEATQETDSLEDETDSVIEESPVTYTITESDDGYTFTTFEDLKELASRTFAGITWANYVGEGALVIEENLTLPDNLGLSAEFLKIPAGITLVTGENTPGINVADLLVDGSLDSYLLYIWRSLTVNGTVRNYDMIYATPGNADPVEIIGQEKIVHMTEFARIDKIYVITEESQIQSLMNAESPYQPDTSYNLSMGSDLVLSASLTIPYEWSLLVESGYNLSIPAGCTLTVDGGVASFGTTSVSGELISNTSGLVVIHKGGKIQVAEGGKMIGSGNYQVIDTAEGSPYNAISGINWDDYSVRSSLSQDGWIVRYTPSDLPQLSMPTDLVWGKEIYPTGSGSEVVEVDIPGMISWKAGESTQNSYEVSFYRVGESEPIDTSWSIYPSDWFIDWFSDYAFIRNTPESGSYYFTVRSIGDGVSYRDSETAVSETWTYTKPSQKLDSCSNLGWDWPVMHWTSPSDSSYMGSLMVDILYAATADAEPLLVHSISGMFVQENFRIPDTAIQDNGVGYYYFRVRPLSRDITVMASGDWSELSPAYNLTVTSENTNEALDNILNSGSSNEEKIQAVQDMDTQELKSSMLADQQTLDKLKELETTAAGGTAPIQVSEHVPEIDANGVSIIGANLNLRQDAQKDVSLVIDKPAKENVIPEQYDNSLAVQFSMTLDNVQDPENLEVPVHISLPIPQMINPSFLVILHYRADGSYEQIYPQIVYTPEGNFANFVLTSFSDFVLTQPAGGEVTDLVPMYRLYNPYTLEHLFTSSEWERDNLPNAGWIYEGVAWNAPTEGAPIYRLYNPYTDGHFYTASEEEIDTLLPLGWKLDGAVSNGASADGTPIYRLFNPYETKNYHHYTTSSEEISMLTSLGWVLEGVAWYAA